VCGGSGFPPFPGLPHSSAIIQPMPVVNGKKYPYTAKGKKAAAAAKKKKTYAKTKR